VSLHGWETLCNYYKTTVLPITFQLLKYQMHLTFYLERTDDRCSSDISNQLDVIKRSLDAMVGEMNVFHWAFEMMTKDGELN
jgi:hypothetical protein